MAPAAVMNKVDLSSVDYLQEKSPRKAKNKANTFPKSVPLLPSAQSPPPEQKKVNRRSNKLIPNWLHRKLVGTKKAENSSHARTKPRGASRVVNRLTTSHNNGSNPHFRAETPPTRRKTVSLNGDSGANDSPLDDEDDISYRPSSVTRESLWAPASVQEADDDASVRPLPPTIPPSPSPSRSSSSYLSHPHTFKSIAASTKPTTLLSIDINSTGMAHIAQAPLTSQSHVGRFTPNPHARHPSLTSGSISFSALSGPTRSNSTAVNSSTNTSQGQGYLLTVQAPLHTTHHPRNNPRPSSPPMDNASMLTLASSAFGIPGRPGIAGSTASALGAGDSISHFEGSMAYPDEGTSIVSGDDDRLYERDFDASVRALRPRSSRRGSWDSETSGWSAGLQQTPSVMPEKSVWTANSDRTEGFSADNVEVEQNEGETGKKETRSVTFTQDATADLGGLSSRSEQDIHPIHDSVAPDADGQASRANSTDIIKEGLSGAEEGGEIPPD